MLATLLPTFDACWTNRQMVKTFFIFPYWSLSFLVEALFQTDMWVSIFSKSEIVSWNRVALIESVLLKYCPFLTIVLSLGHFSHIKSGLPFTGKASCDSRAIQPVVHAGCFGVSIIHWILTRTVSTDVNACDCTWGCKGTVQESALKADSGRKIPSCTGELNLLQPSASPMIYQLSYIPTPRLPKDPKA